MQSVNPPPPQIRSKNDGVEFMKQVDTAASSRILVFDGETSGHYNQDS